MGKDMKAELDSFIAGARLDFQKTRMMGNNRLRNLLRRRLMEIEGVEEKIEDDEKSYGEEWSDKKIDEKLREAIGDGKLTQKDYDYLQSIRALTEKFDEEEKAYEKMFKQKVATYPIYNEWLKNVKGMGATNSLTLIAILGDCHQFATRSKLWAYAGFKVVDGKAVKRTRGEKMNWNPTLKTRMFVIGDNFIKARNKYREKVYDVEKARLKAEHPEPVEIADLTKKGKKRKLYTPMHIDRMARRKMVKLFLSHYWEVARKLAGLPIDNAYAVEHGHHHAPPGDFIDRGSL